MDFIKLNVVKAIGEEHRAKLMTRKCARPILRKPYGPSLSRLMTRMLGLFTREEYRLVYLNLAKQVAAHEARPVAPAGYHHRKIGKKYFMFRNPDLYRRP